MFFPNNNTYASIVTVDAYFLALAFTSLSFITLIRLHLQDFVALLTHVQLPDKTGHVVVFEILGQDFLCKSTLIKHMEAGAILK